MQKKEKKYVSKDDALKKLQRYCAYQERCHQEVRNKLIDLGIYGDDLEDIIVDLITDNFLNEERYAKIYAGGKFRIKKWGRFKIKQKLKFKRVSAYCIKQAMLEIDEFDYIETLHKILKKKRKTERETNEFKLKGRLAKYAINKGYESWIVWEELKKMDLKKNKFN